MSIKINKLCNQGMITSCIESVQKRTISANSPTSTGHLLIYLGQHAPLLCSAVIREQEPLLEYEYLIVYDYYIIQGNFIYTSLKYLYILFVYF